MKEGDYKMKKDLDVKIERSSINFLDNIVYSQVKDLEGNKLDLKLSIMLKDGNSEMKLAAGFDDSEKKSKKRPALVWVPGGGYRGCDKNLMVSEMQFLAEAGFVVASIYYRSSAQGKAPDQIIDVKTAIRYIRAHAEEYDIDPEQIGVLGRSAGGHLAALAAMNTDEFESDEWSDYSSEVQACYNMFGPTDFGMLYDFEVANLQKPDYRWSTMLETHIGAVIGGDETTIRERAEIYTVKNYISDKASPMLIIHGDADPLVPDIISDELYQALCDAGLENQTDYYVLKGAAHGSDEFFQEPVKSIVVDFFKDHLVTE